MQFLTTIFISILLFAILLNASTEYHGVCWDKSRSRYYALINYYDNSKKKRLKKCRGFYEEPKDAAIAVDELCDLYRLGRKNFDVDGKRMKLKCKDKLIANDTSTEYNGVCWDKSREQYYGLIIYYDNSEKKALKKRRGFYDEPKDAAIAVDELCNLYGLKRKNFDVDGTRIKLKRKRKYILIADVSNKESEILAPECLMETDNFNAKLISASNQEMTSELANAAEKYKGVTWDKGTNQWKTYVTLRHGKRKQKFGKTFYNLLDAAKEVDRLCNELNLPRQNFDLEGNRILPKVNTRLINVSTEYNGVCWEKSRGRYYASITYYDKSENKAIKKRQGFYDEAKEAAIAVDQLCDLYGFERRNFDVDGKRINVRSPKTTSIYHGVVKCKRTGKWITYVNLAKSKQIFGKKFDEELEAAWYADKLCDKHGLERRNFELDGTLKLNKIKKTSKYQYVYYQNHQNRWKISKDRKKSFNCKSEGEVAEKSNENCQNYGSQPKKFTSKDKHETGQSNPETYDLKNAKETTIPIEINRLMQNEKENLLKRKRDMAKAVAEDHLDIVEAIYAEGWIDPNYMDDFDISLVGLDPIFNVKSWEMTQFLVNQDARTRDIVNTDGETPFEAARRKGEGYEGAVQFFEQDFELDRAAECNRTCDASAIDF